MWGRRYSTSKLCSVLCTYEMDRRLKTAGASTPDRPITANAFDPGLMPGTGPDPHLWSGGPIRVALVIAASALILRPLSANIHTPNESGRALARLVVDPALESVSGRYFEGLKEIRSSVESYDEAKAVTLWDETELVALGLIGSSSAPALRRLDP